MCFLSWRILLKGVLNLFHQSIFLMIAILKVNLVNIFFKIKQFWLNLADSDMVLPKQSSRHYNWRCLSFNSQFSPNQTRGAREILILSLFLSLSTGKYLGLNSLSLISLLVTSYWNLGVTNSYEHHVHCADCAAAF